MPDRGVVISVRMETARKLNRRFGDPDRHLNAVIDGLKGVLYPDDCLPFVRGESIMVVSGERDLIRVVCSACV